jgi:hypothetical protein
LKDTSQSRPYDSSDPPNANRFGCTREEQNVFRSRTLIGFSAALLTLLCTVP